MPRLDRAPSNARNELGMNSTATKQSHMNNNRKQKIYKDSGFLG